MGFQGKHHPAPAVGRGWAEQMEQAEKDWAEAGNTGQNEENPEGRQ